MAGFDLEVHGIPQPREAVRLFLTSGDGQMERIRVVDCHGVHSASDAAQVLVKVRCSFFLAAAADAIKVQTTYRVKGYNTKIRAAKVTQIPLRSQVTTLRWRLACSSCTQRRSTPH